MFSGSFWCWKVKFLFIFSFSTEVSRLYAKTTRNGRLVIILSVVTASPYSWSSLEDCLLKWRPKKVQKRRSHARFRQAWRRLAGVMCVISSSANTVRNPSAHSVANIYINIYCSCWVFSLGHETGHRTQETEDKTLETGHRSQDKGDRGDRGDRREDTGDRRQDTLHLPFRGMYYNY